MRAALIGRSQAAAAFDRYPWSQQGRRGHGQPVTKSHFAPCVDEVIGNTDAQPRLHPMEQLERLLEQMREEGNEEPGREKEGPRVLIDPWSERLCPLISQAEEKDFGLRCLRMSLFGG